MDAYRTAQLQSAATALDDAQSARQTVRCYVETRSTMGFLTTFKRPDTLEVWVLFFAPLLTTCSLHTMEASSTGELLSLKTIVTCDAVPSSPPSVKMPVPTATLNIPEHDEDAFPLDPTNPSYSYILVTRDDATLPEGCTPLDIARFIVGFFDAYNRGNEEQLASLFLLGQNQGFSVIAFIIKLTAKDLEPGKNGSERFAVGKGAILCKSGKIMAWSVGITPPDTQTSSLPTICPSPPHGSPKDAAIACTRGP